MFRKKIEWKLRYYYLLYFQKKNKRLWLYKAVRHARKMKNDYEMKRNNIVSQYMTKLVNPTAGIGDQLASFHTGYFYAKIFKLCYAYSPLYPQSWNIFFGYAEKEIDAERLCKEENYRKIRLPYFDHKNHQEFQFIKNIIQSYRGEKIIFYIENNQVYGEQYGVSDSLRDKFNAANARSRDKLIYDKRSINIAVHVRRGDITEGQLNQNPELVMRWLENDYYIKVLQQLINLIKNECSYKIYFFSQGERKEFEEFNSFDHLIFCLEMGIQESFLHLVRADIIITSKSSFSYKPALLADGLRICPKHFWHGYPKDEKWIVVNEKEPKLNEEQKQAIMNYIEKQVGNDG